MDVQKPLLQRVVALPPFLLDRNVHDSLAETPDLKMDTSFLKPTWTYAKKSKDGNRLPQTIAHRGFKAKHPENTMGAFKGAVKVGTHAIETDIHLSKDDVVVLSHDATLKRCFGKDQKVLDCSWEYISKLRTLKEPHEPMPRLVELLEYLASPGLEHIWLLLDIKLDNNADKVMRLIAKAIQQVSPNPNKPWNQRIVLGCWAVKFLPLCVTYLPTFPITHIGFSISYARRFLAYPHVSFNILQKVLMGPFGSKFLRDAQSVSRPVYVWTVNEDEMMRWSINKGVDGVITDDPQRFLEICAEWESGRRAPHVTWRQWMQVLWINLLVCVFGTIFWWRYSRGQKGQKTWMKEAVDPPLEQSKVLGEAEREDEESYDD
ncbi:hypothetical protein MMC08_004687 [Hypocenomyce scalaris]|nr:hypothetical protein [Hypocenomyce scalaris]